MERNMYKKAINLTLLGIYDEDLNRFRLRVGKDRAESSFKTLRQGRGYVAAFLREWFGVEDIGLGELTPQFITDFSVWLSAERGLRGGTVWLACQLLKGVVTRAHGRGLLLWNPFCQFHIAKNIRPREYLTEEELLKLIKAELPKANLRFARDIFVFAAFTGLSFIDIRELRGENIIEVYGSEWICTKRHKTGIPFQVKLLPVAQEIIRRHGTLSGGRIFGDLQYRTLAKQVAKVMNVCGFRKHITLHCARHSFAVLALSKGMPIESVSRILGHTNITTTQIYAKITMQKLDHDMTAFAERLKSDIVEYTLIQRI